MRWTPSLGITLPIWKYSVKYIYKVYFIGGSFFSYEFQGLDNLGATQQVLFLVGHPKSYMDGRPVGSERG
jgi:hypothetical protein